jgi:hypothetical protein
MRAASSGAQDFVAEGGASALGSVASFGWIAPQAANKTAKPASGALNCAVRVDFDGREAMDRSNFVGTSVSRIGSANRDDQRPGA